MREAGIRVLVGGDYGLTITPHGTYSRELRCFADYFGFSSSEALQAANKYGGEAFMPEDHLGTLEEGKIYTDLLATQSPHQKDAAVLGHLLGTPPCN